jgi:hypothetical protein
MKAHPPFYVSTRAKIRPNPLLSVETDYFKNVYCILANFRGAPAAMVESCELNIGAHNNWEELDATADPDCRGLINAAAVGGSLILGGWLRI